MALTDNLLHYYNVNSNFNDSVGSTNLSTSWVSYSSWKISNAASYATNGYAQTTSALYPIIMTINMWMYLNDTNDTQYWLKHDWTNSRPWLYCRLISAVPTKVLFYHYDEWWWWARTMEINRSSFPTWEWFMFTWTSWGSWAGMKVFVNTSSVGTSWTTTQSQTANPVGANIWWYDTSWWNNPHWLFDEIWIRDRVLTSAEISSLYNWWSWLAYPFTTAAAFVPKITIF